MNTTVSFEYVQRMVRVPVELGDDSYQFLVDTGIGITVVSSALAARSDVNPTGDTFTGRRMSGQQVEIPLVRLPALTLGDYAVGEHLAGVADLGAIDGPNGFAGILGPAFFRNHVVTTDPDAMTLAVEAGSDVEATGAEIPLEIRRSGPSWDPFTTLVLPSGRKVCVEVDTGSDSLILDSRFMHDCGVNSKDADLTTATGTDETGFNWTRHWATISGDVYLAAAPQTAQSGARVMFQDIIHDGLVGTDYLNRFRMSLDVSGARLILSPRTSA